jgi:hypothetical protein
MNLNLDTIRDQMLKEKQNKQAYNISIFNGSPGSSSSNISPINQEGASFSK